MIKIKIFVISVLTSCSLFLGLAAPAYALPLPRTGTVWQITSGSGGVDVIPYIKADRLGMFVDFESSSFTNVASIYYNVQYDTDDNGGLRGIEGTIWPTNDQIYAWYSGRPYIRRQFLFGTCSQGVCTYNSRVRNVRITVKTTLNSGNPKEFTKYLSISY